MQNSTQVVSLHRDSDVLLCSGLGDCADRVDEVTYLIDTLDNAGKPELKVQQARLWKAGEEVRGWRMYAWC